MKNKIIISSITLAVYMSIAGLIFADEPARPYVYSSFDVEKEQRIDQISKLLLKEAIEELKGTEFLVNEEYLNKAIFVSFMNRKAEAINFVLDYFELPRVEIIEGKRINRGNDLFIGKKILQVFPEESFSRISEVYDRSALIKKTNIIEVLGTMYGPEIKSFLITALDDKNSSDEEIDEGADEELLEIEGEPMRICDVAYNQLVLRYQIKDVLRTIGPAHSIENRDYHIEILKGKL